jgi:hypothetical protein
MGVAAELAARLAAGTLRPASAEAVARQVAGRLERERLARRAWIVGRSWLVPTGRGLSMAAEGGDAYPLWRPVGWRLAHVETVARLRLALCDQHPGAAWESERSIRRRLAEEDKGKAVKLGGRAVDGGLEWPDGRRVAVECELTTKKRWEYAQLVKDLNRGDWRDGVWWYARPGRVGWLRERLAEAGAVDHQVLVLPEGVAR